MALTRAMRAAFAPNATLKKDDKFPQQIFWQANCIQIYPTGTSLRFTFQKTYAKDFFAFCWCAKGIVNTAITLIYVTGTSSIRHRQFNPLILEVHVCLCIVYIDGSTSALLQKISYSSNF